MDTTDPKNNLPQTTFSALDESSLAESSPEKSLEVA